jgi:hypothetical protein
MSYTPRHEGARVWPSKPRLLVAGLLIICVATAATVASSVTSAPWLTGVTIGCVVVIGGVVNRVLDGRRRRVHQDSAAP